VHFRLDDGTPYFASYVAANWRQYAADWSWADRQALAAWFTSDTATEARAEAIHYIRALQGGQPLSANEYPYLLSAERAIARTAAYSALH
jgi:hypothetical protein